MNFEEKIKKQYIKKWLKIPTRHQKIWSRNWKNKLPRRRNVVEKSQSVKKVRRDQRPTLLLIFSWSHTILLIS